MKHYIPYLLALIAALGASAQAPQPNAAPKTTVHHQLAWDASTTSGVTYILRRGIQPGVYVEMVEVAALTYNWTNAPAKLTNYYVVSSKIPNGLESDYSNEIRVEPTPRPAAPNLRTAVPVTVELYRREPGQLWAKAITVGPFYDDANKPAEEFSAVVRVGKPIQLLPE